MTMYIATNNDLGYVFAPKLPTEATIDDLSVRGKQKIKKGVPYKF